MTALLAASVATSNTATEGDVKTFLENIRSYIAELLGTDSSNRAAVQSLIGCIMNGSISAAGAYTVVEASRGKVINATGSWTLSISAAASLSDGFTFAVRNSGSGAITIDPNMSELINGLPSVILGAGEFVLIFCDGIGFSTVGGSSAPAGSMLPYAGSSTPVGWLLCYGQAVSRALYPALFTAIGTTYGAGDGSTTFNIPDLRGRVIAGKDNMGGSAAGRLTSPVSGITLGGAGGFQSHTLTIAEMPSHNHSITTLSGNEGSGSPASATQQIMGTTGNTGGGGAHNNVQPTIIANYIIRT